MKQPALEPRIIQTQRTIAYEPGEIYAAFSDPARLAVWWGPNGFTNTVEIFDFKTGGDWKYVMHGPNGHDYSNKSVFHEIKPNEKIVIQHISAPRFMLTITLSRTDNGTLIEWIQAFEDVKVADAVRHIVEPSNEQNLDRLEMHLRGEL